MIHPWSEELKPFIRRVINLIEIERMLMGLGKYEIATHIGITYHTYNSFVNERQIITGKTFNKMLKFLETRNKKINDIPCLNLFDEKYKK